MDIPGLPEDTRVSLEHFDISGLSDGRISAELAALQFQHNFFQHELGPFLPDQINPAKVQTVLDLVCNMGSWCTDFNKYYPGREIYGVEMSEKILKQARANAAPSHTGNIHFVEAKSLPLTAFADERFDLIHMLNPASLFPLEAWPAIMKELFRLLKPGGWVHFVDVEMGPVSTPAMDRVTTLLAQIVAKLGRSTSPNGMLPFNGCAFGPQRMADSSFTDINYTLHPLNLGGWNNPMGRAYLTSHMLRPEIITYYATKFGLSTEKELQPLLKEVRREVRHIGFCAVAMVISATARKPLVNISST